MVGGFLEDKRTFLEIAGNSEWVISYFCKPCKIQKHLSFFKHISRHKKNDFLLVDNIFSLVLKLVVIVQVPLSVHGIVNIMVKVNLV